MTPLGLQNWVIERSVNDGNDWFMQFGEGGIKMILSYWLDYKNSNFWLMKFWHMWCLLKLFSPFIASGFCISLTLKSVQNLSSQLSLQCTVAFESNVLCSREGPNLAKSKCTNSQCYNSMEIGVYLLLQGFGPVSSSKSTCWFSVSMLVYFVGNLNLIMKDEPLHSM